jgi:hypothetical protein
MQISTLIRQLRGIVNLGGGTQLDGGFTGLTPRVKTTKMGGHTVRSALNKQLGAKNMATIPLDSHYWVPEREGFNQLVTTYRDEIGANIYQGDAYDCDNYALDMMNFFQNQCGINSVGFVYDGDSRHAYNVVIYNDADGLRATLFEPNFWSLGGGEVEATDRDGKYSVHTSTVLL